MLGPILVVDASSIDKINMDIMVDIYGNAFVTETWIATVDEGTEGWHPYYNLGNSTIGNLIVFMDGREFTTIDDWNINRSLSEKAYQAGIYYPSSDEVDICFGITSYGNHEYKIQYKTQYWFDDCRIQLPLPFDFALFKDDKLIGLCEYQGEQHYEPVDFANKGVKWAEKQFERNQISDNIKRTYCKDKDIF